MQTPTQAQRGGVGWCSTIAETAHRDLPNSLYHNGTERDTLASVTKFK